MRPDLLTGELDRAAGRLDQAEKKAPRRRFAAAALSDQGQDLTLPEREGDAVDGMDVRVPPGDDVTQAAAHREEALEVFDLDEGGGLVAVADVMA